MKSLRRLLGLYSSRGPTHIDWDISSSLYAVGNWLLRCYRAPRSVKGVLIGVVISCLHSRQKLFAVPCGWSSTRIFRLSPV